MQRVFCNDNKCGKQFDVEVKVKEIDNGYMQVYFNCPHCKKEYPCYKESQWTLSLQEQINEILSSISNCMTKIPYEKLKKRYKTLKEQKRKALEKINYKG